jgi:integrase
MTLADLLTALDTRGALPASRAKDCKTSLRYLASALGTPSLDACPVDAACRDPVIWTDTLEAHFQALTAQGRTISAATRRNTRNNLRVLFRLAETHGLLTAPLPPRLLMKRKRDDFALQQRQTAPYQTTYHIQGSPRHFGLPQAQWPPAIQTGWRAYQAKCGLRLRPITLRAHANRLTIYLGYLTNICGRTPTWDDLFDVASLAEFVRWHGARVGRPIATHGHAVVQTIGAMAVVLKHPHARELADFRNTLPKPPPLHSKRAHWVSLAQLEAVAEACLTAGRVPTVLQSGVRNPGLRRASEFQRGVMLKLLVRVPLRSRNVREMRVGEHLYQDQAGHWQLSFRGAELKIGERQGQINTYHVDLTDYCPDFLPVLEEFLQVHRPRLPGATASPFLFLSSRGAPYTTRSLHQDLAYIVTLHTGQRFYPHLIRTIWATEYLQATQDFTTAATMLGDTLVVVMRTYYDVVHRDQHQKARAFLGTALHTG